jgi:hypothetical protein
VNKVDRDRRNMLLSRICEWEKIKAQEKNPDGDAFVQETLRLLEVIQKKRRTQ